MGGRIWNSIPTELREKSKNHLKKVLHRKLLQVLEKKDDYIDILTIQKEIAIIEKLNYFMILNLSLIIR